MHFVSAALNGTVFCSLMDTSFIQSHRNNIIENQGSADKDNPDSKWINCSESRRVKHQHAEHVIQARQSKSQKQESGESQAGQETSVKIQTQNRQRKLSQTVEYAKGGNKGHTNMIKFSP